MTSQVSLDVSMFTTQFVLRLLMSAKLIFGYYWQPCMIYFFFLSCFHNVANQVFCSGLHSAHMRVSIPLNFSFYSNPSSRCRNGTEYIRLTFIKLSIGTVSPRHSSWHIASLTYCCFIYVAHKLGEQRELPRNAFPFLFMSHTQTHI